MSDHALGTTGILLAVALTFGMGLPADISAAPAGLSTDAAHQASQRGKAPKVDVCHITDTGEYVLTNVNENALQAHLDHGDAVAGGDELDENCALVQESSSVLTFVSVSATTTSFSQTYKVSWTVEGSSEFFFFIVESSLDGSTWQLACESSCMTGGSGNQSYETFFGSPYQLFRIRAIRFSDGTEVISAPTSVF